MGLGIGTIRVIAVVLLQVALLTTPQIFVPVFWTGWVVSLAAGELWVRINRPAVVPARAVAA